MLWSFVPFLLCLVATSSFLRRTYEKVEQPGVDGWIWHALRTVALIATAASLHFAVPTSSSSQMTETMTVVVASFALLQCPAYLRYAKQRDAENQPAELPDPPSPEVVQAWEARDAKAMRILGVTWLLLAALPVAAFLLGVWP